MDRKKTAVSMERAAVDSHVICFGLTVAGRTAGARLHAGEHETLPFLEIDVCAFEHLVRTLFQEYFQTLQLKGRVAFYGRFGYVHSQRGASAARDDKYPDSVSGCPLLFNDVFELSYCFVGQTYHISSLLVSYT